MDELDRDRILPRLDHMVANGKVTEAEAASLRAATAPDEIDAAIGTIRLRHAAPELADAVARGALTEAEAEAVRDRVRAGEHPRSLRAHLRRRRGAPDG